MRIAGSDTCTLYMLDQSGSTLELLGERGAAPEVVRHIRRISSSEGNPDVLRYVLAGQSLWAETEADYRALFPAIASLKSEARRAQAFWSVPLVVEGRPLGLIAMGFYEPRKFSREDRSLVETLSNQCGQALARAMRTEREDETRRWLGTTLRSIGDAVIATDPDGRVTFMNPVAESLTGFSAVEARGQFLRLRREFLTRSSEVFLTSLDYQSTLATVAQLAVPAIADWCGVDLLDAHGKAPYQAAVAHIDPGKLAFARQLGAQYPPSPSAKTGAPEVIRTGKPELYATISDTLIK
jgi:PAS domain-containing protein